MGMKHENFIFQLCFNNAAAQVSNRIPLNVEIVPITLQINNQLGNTLLFPITRQLSTKMHRFDFESLFVYKLGSDLLPIKTNNVFINFLALCKIP
jgi:hypothetical protein